MLTPSCDILCRWIQHIGIRLNGFMSLYDFKRLFITYRWAVRTHIVSR